MRGFHRDPGHILPFPGFRIGFWQGFEALTRGPRAWARLSGSGRRHRAERICMNFQHVAGAAYRALTARKDGPSLYDVCDPLLLKTPAGGDPHLSKFYRTALGNPALRPLLRRTGLTELRDEACLRRLREALTCARDDDVAGLGRDRPAGGGAARHHRAAASKTRAGGATRPRACPRPRSSRSSAPAARICCARSPATASSRPMPPST